MSVAESNVAPTIPENWMPEGAVTLAIAKYRPEDDLWEVIVPFYALVGRGTSFELAAKQAGELLEDYFASCAEDGKSFHESRRPMPVIWTFSTLGQAIVAGIVRRIRHSRVRTRVLRIPAGHAYC